MIDKQYIKEHLSFGKYSKGHMAEGEFYGFGMLYYSLAYCLKAENICVLGSGNGFVPKAFRQGQRDSISNGKTILVDGNTGSWGRPNYLEENSHFRKTFPEIEIIVSLTKNAYKEFVDQGKFFDIIHIDADHSFEGALEDFENYINILNDNGIILMHDTSPKMGLPCAKVVEVVREKGYQVVNFDDYGAGVALIRK